MEAFMEVLEAVIEQSSIDITPLIASPERLLAPGARVVLHDPAKQKDVPKPAIRPYPIQYVSKWRMKDGREITIRPIRPKDEPAMAEFHRTLSDRTVYLRYFASLSLSTRIAHERLLSICFGDYNREMVLVAEYHYPHSETSRIVGVGRLNKMHAGNEAGAAVLVSDAYQNLGLGYQLLSRLIGVARDEKLSRVSCEMMLDNRGMQILSKRLGFRLRSYDSGESVAAVLEL